jgi:hypothetical protein
MNLDLVNNSYVNTSHDTFRYICSLFASISNDGAADQKGKENGNKYGELIIDYIPMMWNYLHHYDMVKQYVSTHDSVTSVIWFWDQVIRVLDTLDPSKRPPQPPRRPPSYVDAKTQFWRGHYPKAVALLKPTLVTQWTRRLKHNRGIVLHDVIVNALDLFWNQSKKNEIRKNLTNLTMTESEVWFASHDFIEVSKVCYRLLEHDLLKKRTLIVLLEYFVNPSFSSQLIPFSVHNLVAKALRDIDIHLLRWLHVHGFCVHPSRLDLDELMTHQIATHGDKMNAIIDFVGYPLASLFSDIERDPFLRPPGF